ncbi:hypothetical protein F5B21DRAFT_468055 [Xylaria acuta]|nr:hypothetical protein F5B21DRAFT_468055 [Xylaria acuta]
MSIEKNSPNDNFLMAADEAEQLLARLIQWKHTYHDQPTSSCILSEEWFAFQNDKWQKYDILNNRRLHLGISPLPWQGEVGDCRVSLGQFMNEAEQLLTQLAQWKQTYDNESTLHYIFSAEWDAFQHDKWQQYDMLESRRLTLNIPPLAWHHDMQDSRISLERLRTQKFHSLTKELYHICPLAVRLSQFEPRFSQQRLYSWAAMMTSWRDFQLLYQSNKEFWHCLSASQRASYLLLRDWWDASYCDPYFLSEAQTYIEMRKDVPYTTPPTTPGGLEDAIDTKLNASLYQASCFNLFLREFHPQTWEPNLCLVYLPVLRSFRYEAGCHALAQRVSFAALGAPRLGVNISFPAVPPNEMPWERRKDTSDFPRYLWDKDQMKTVLFDSIPGQVEYMCVSHTWGRWRCKDASEVKIPGVDWKVPKNERFDVQNLPEKLKRLPLRYLWIDLFCIPQDNSPEADIEIARQASIFRGCRRCIAWINDVTSWDGVKSGLKWLSLKWQRNTMRHYGASTPGHRSVSEEDLALAAQEAEQQAELCQLESKVDEPVSWFSSLWTLQEAVLCPDMILCSCDWTQLTDGWNAPITLQALVGFLNQCHLLCSTEGPLAKDFMQPLVYTTALQKHLDYRQWDLNIDSWPMAARQLNHVRIYTRLDNALISRSPAAICANANVRYCESTNRAPAIMSALGVTDWYTQSTLSSATSSSGSPALNPLPVRRGSVRKSKSPTEATVLGMYPLKFLQEAHIRFGASFFETSSWSFCVDDYTKAALGKGQSMGTMLPFTKTQGWKSGVAGTYGASTKTQVVDHQSVANWEIREDGSVAMTSVGCVFSTTNDRHHKAAQHNIRASVNVAGESRNTRKLEHSDNVVEYLAGIAGADGVVYGVALYEDCYIQYGILLYGLLDQDAVMEEQRLMKIGNFIAHEFGEVETRSVHWTVL